VLQSLSHSFLADQFYLVGSGYPNMLGFLAPYRGRRYHLCDYVGREDSMERKNYSTIDTHHVVTLLNVALEF